MDESTEVTLFEIEGVTFFVRSWAKPSWAVRGTSIPVLTKGVTKSFARAVRIANQAHIKIREIYPDTYNSYLEINTPNGKLISVCDENREDIADHPYKVKVMHRIREDEEMDYEIVIHKEEKFSPLVRKGGVYRDEYIKRKGLGDWE